MAHKVEAPARYVEDASKAKKSTQLAAAGKNKTKVAAPDKKKKKIKVASH
jgi:16S rRNA C967 or C1407 C5-methylase (RsmB/RsmF family)